MHIIRIAALWIMMIIFSIFAAFVAAIIIAWVYKHPETAALCLFGVWVIRFGWVDVAQHLV